MLTYRIILIRHGITSGNLEGKYIGLTDLPLCDEGKDVLYSLKAAELYPEVQKVYSAPLLRCTQTAEILYPEMPLHEIDNIAECDFGEFEGKTPDELMKLPEYVQWLKGGYQARPTNGESHEEFTLRCLGGLEDIFMDMMQNKVYKSAVITHSGVIMNLLCGFGIPKAKPSDHALKQGEGVEIMLTPYLWQKGPAFEIAGRIF